MTRKRNSPDFCRVLSKHLEMLSKRLGLYSNAIGSVQVELDGPFGPAPLHSSDEGLTAPRKARDSGPEDLLKGKSEQ